MESTMGSPHVEPLDGDPMAGVEPERVIWLSGFSVTVGPNSNGGGSLRFEGDYGGLSFSHRTIGL